MLRIAQIRTLVAGGDYSVDPVVVAEALLTRIASRRRIAGFDLRQPWSEPGGFSRSGAPSPRADRRERRAG